MARVERFTSTAPIPVERAQLIDPTAFRFSTASAEAFKAIGGVLEELGKRAQAANDSLAINAAGESRDLAKLQMKQFMLNNPDPAIWAEGARKIIGEQNKVFAQQRFSAEALKDEQIEQQAFEDELNAGVSILSTTQIIDNDITVSGKNLIDKIANDDGSAIAAADIDKQLKLYQAALERRDTKEVAAIKMTETLREAEKQRVSVLMTQGKFSEARELVHASKAFEAEDAVATLKRIDITEDYQKRKTIDLDHEADMNVNEDFVSQIMNQDLVPDVVQNSRLDDKTPRGIFSVDKLSKQEWIQYVGASFDDPPQKTTPKGFGSASSTVFDYAKFQIPKEAAYRRLLDSRYIHKEITDEDFAWAINHINKPYPRHLVADIETVTQSNRDVIARGGFLWGLITTDAEEEKARAVNTELISWLDNEIAQDREPTREQMYGQSAQLRSQSGKDDTQRVATPATKAEYNKLLSGTVYLDPETGNLYRKK